MQAALNIAENGKQNRNYTIITDSRSSLHAIETPTVTRPIISTMQSKIIQIKDSRKNIHLCWVPSHCNVSGNERADREAKAAATDLTIPMHSEAVPYENMRAIIKNRTNTKGQSDWERIDQVRGR